MKIDDNIKKLIIKTSDDLDSWYKDALNHLNSSHYVVTDDIACDDLEKLNEKVNGNTFSDVYDLAENKTGQGDPDQINKVSNMFGRVAHDYLTGDNSEQRYQNSIPTKFNKDDLIDMAQSVLAENAGWWTDDDPDDKENLHDIHKTQDLLDNGKLEDPYGSIENAYDDYHEYITGSEDNKHDKQAQLNELNALISAVD